MLKILVILFVITMVTAIYHPTLPASCQAEDKANRATYVRPSGRTCSAVDKTMDHPMTRQGMLKPYKKWLKNTMIYDISPDFDDCRRDLILEGMKAITLNTDDCIKFKQWTNEPDYVSIVTNDTGCYATGLGRQDGQMILNLNKDPQTGCFWCEDTSSGTLCSGTPTHEIIHALGFTHEHQRSDRDEYITVNYENMNTSAESNFEIMDRQKLLGSYDYYSLMHYDGNSFSNNEKPTMVAKKNKRIVLGKSDEMTKKDILKLKKYYRCR